MKKRVIKITIVEYVRDEKKEVQQEESKTGLKMCEKLFFDWADNYLRDIFKHKDPREIQYVAKNIVYENYKNFAKDEAITKLYFIWFLEFFCRKKGYKFFEKNDDFVFVKDGQVRDIVGDVFWDWAEGYFEEVLKREGKEEINIQKEKIYEAYKECAGRHSVAAYTFKKYLKKYCECKGLKFNPEDAKDYEPGEKKIMRIEKEGDRFVSREYFRIVKEK